MRRLAQLAALAAAAVLAQAANAGRLLSATFQQQLLFGTPIISVTSTSATGSFTGTSFRLDAGSWFATSGCLGPRAGCAPATLPSLLSRVTFRIDARSNA